jgi:hypothetical protein
MLTCNRPQLISAIESILEQHYQAWELIVVHDGPNQQTKNVMQGSTDHDSRIRYFHRQQWGNIAQATNFGLAQARGAYISILDDDGKDDYVPWPLACKFVSSKGIRTADRCGIAGLTNFGGGAPPADLLHEMIHMIHHRGPDAIGLRKCFRTLCGAFGDGPGTGTVDHGPAVLGGGL